MTFASLNFLTILIYLLIFSSGIFLVWQFHSKREQLKNTYTLLFSGNKQIYTSIYFLLASLIIISLSIFGIQYSLDSETQNADGIDVVFVLDVSKSMNSLDYSNNGYYVSRLDYTKNIIQKYVLRNPENRYGLVIFAGDAVSASPLTTDHSTFNTFLSSIDYTNLSIQGTNLEKAIELGVQRLSSNKFDSEESPRAKALILISDGGDEGDRVNFTQIKKIIENQNITSIVVGVGTTSGGRIPIGADIFGQISYQKYKGEEVITKLNSDLLKELAGSLDAEYMNIGDLESGDKIIAALDTLEKKAIQIAATGTQKDASRFIIIIGAILFLISLFYKKKAKRDY